MTEREIINRLKELRSVNDKSVKLTEQEQAEHYERKKRWLQFWRNNPNLYIHYKMGITNFPYEHHSLYLMGDSTQYTEISTRGTAKSFRVIEYAVSQCLLKPFCQVVLLAVTRDQASDDYREKFIKEMVNKKSMSPLVSHLYDIGMITSKEVDKGHQVTFWNGSSITFAACIPSTRGLRANILILEECRLMKKGDIDSIGIPMLFPRQPEWKNLDKYKSDRSHDELEQVIYITSNRFKHEWFNTLFNKTFVGYFTERSNKHRVFAVDIFLSIKWGLKTPQWYFAQQKSMDEANFAMEILNQSIGEVDGAYFSLEQFQKNRVIKNAFRPPTPEEFKNGTVKNRKKKENEYRFVFLDFAWAGNSATNLNDQTVIGCGSCYMKNNKLYREVEYLETYSGSDASLVPLRFKELFWDYQADYGILD